MSESGLVRLPEWKQLYGDLAGIINPGDVLTYDSLSELAGIDVRGHRGRSQFHRFAREVLVTRRLHFENVPNVGYRVVEPREHVNCGYRQIGFARRRVKKAVAIIGNARIESLTDRERAANADALARSTRLLGDVSEARRDVRKIAASGDLKRLPSPLLDAAEKRI